MHTKKVTFILAAEIVADASNGLLLGEFNNWDIEQGFSLKKSKDGTMKATLSLEAGRSYQYRYLLEGGRWVNDHNADGYTQIEGLDVANCIVHVPVPEVKAPKAATAKKPVEAVVKAKSAGKKVNLPVAEKKASGAEKATSAKPEKKEATKAAAKSSTASTVKKAAVKPAAKPAPKAPAKKKQDTKK